MVFFRKCFSKWLWQQQQRRWLAEGHHFLGDVYFCRIYASANSSQLSALKHSSIYAWFNLFSAQSIIIICIKISDIVAVIWQSPALLWSFYWACLHCLTQPIILTSLKMKMKQTRFQYYIKDKYAHESNELPNFSFIAHKQLMKHL